MSRSLWLADVLADAYRGVKGVRFEVYAGWESRGQAGVSHHGIINHHTGRGGYDALLRYMATGSSIAPLCNVASSHDGSRVTVVASGKGNHAGRGYLPWTGTDRGNWYAVGWEAQNDGSQPWPDKHLETIAIGNAAILKHMRQGVGRLAEHKTYAPSRKVDRHTVDLGGWKHRVQQVMNRQERKYAMVIYAKRGTVDALSALAAHSARPVGVVTQDLGEAQRAVSRGEKVYAVGGPAASELNGGTDVVGSTAAETGRKVFELAQRGW